MNYLRFTIPVLALVLAPSFAFADFDLPPVPPVPSVNVADHCTAADSGGTPHSYSTSQYLGICALVAAKEQSAVSNYELTYDNSFGFYVQSLNGVSPSSTQYWALYLNHGYSNDGLSTMTVQVNDILTFQLTDWTDNSTVGLPVEFSIGSLTSSPKAASTMSGGMTLHDPFSIPRAVVYLWDKQKADGSFGNELLNDWIAIATAGGDAGDIRKHLTEFERTHQPTLSTVTDYERHAMALQALGIDPYTGTPTDYIAPIVAAFDGVQTGDKSLVNDDIFAVFPLLHAGYTQGDNMLQNIGTFIIANQNSDGSWSSNADMTAAGIQAISLLKNIPGAPEAVAKALAYLHKTQAKDGGFGSSQSTSWVLQAIWSQNQLPRDWASDVYFTPDYYLAAKQDVDGGVEPKTTDEMTRMWATAYAIPAIERKPWDELLSTFNKPAPAPAVATSTEVTAASSSEEITGAAPAQPTNREYVAPPQQAEQQAISSEATSSPSQELAAAATATIDQEAMWLLFLLFLIAIGAIWLFEKEIV